MNANKRDIKMYFVQAELTYNCKIALQVRDSADAERTVRGGETGGPALHTSTNIESPFYGWSCKLFRLPALPPYSDEEGERSSMSRHTKEKVETRKKMVSFCISC
jgi:hypothetical protein